MGDFKEQFNNYQQQDAQELLSELLSGLHEDLNRVRDKPYIEMPDSDERSDREMAKEWWRLTLKRDRSVISALFTGQFKSVLRCIACGQRSARFEPFTQLQLPLPQPDHSIATVTVVSLDALRGRDSVRVCAVPVCRGETVADIKVKLAKLVACWSGVVAGADEDGEGGMKRGGGEAMESKEDTKTPGGPEDDNEVTEKRGGDGLPLNIPVIDFLLVNVTQGYVATAVEERRSAYSTLVSRDTIHAFQMLPLAEAMADSAAAAEGGKGGEDYENVLLRPGARVQALWPGQNVNWYPGRLVHADVDKDEYDVDFVDGDSAEELKRHQVRPILADARPVVATFVHRITEHRAVFFLQPEYKRLVGRPFILRVVPLCTTGYQLYRRVWHSTRNVLRGGGYSSCPSPPPLTAGGLGRSQSTDDDMREEVRQAESSIASRWGFVLRKVTRHGTYCRWESTQVYNMQCIAVP